MQYCFIKKKICEFLKFLLLKTELKLKKVIDFDFILILSNETRYLTRSILPDLHAGNNIVV